MNNRKSLGPGHFLHSSTPLLQRGTKRKFMKIKRKRGRGGDGMGGLEVLNSRNYDIYGLSHLPLSLSPTSSVGCQLCLLLLLLFQVLMTSNRHITEIEDCREMQSECRHQSLDGSSSLTLWLLIPHYNNRKKRECVHCMRELLKCGTACARTKQKSGSYWLLIIISFIPISNNGWYESRVVIWHRIDITGGINTSTPGSYNYQLIFMYVYKLCVQELRRFPFNHAF